MRIQYTLKVYPAGLGRSVYRTITICGTDTLDQLCMAILNAFDFTVEHLYEFCMDNKMYSEDCYRFNPMEDDRFDEDDAEGTDIALDVCHPCDENRRSKKTSQADAAQFKRMR